MFEKAFVINLPFKTDRLDVFRKNCPTVFGNVQVWAAVHGDSVHHPDWWTAGSGAWGCYRSHMQILEYCYQNNIESYIVFEDDAIFRPNFDSELEQFMSELPSDWEQIYLGGQLYHEWQHPPKKLSESIYIPYNVNRTHCFAVHRRGYEKLYRHLHAAPFAKNEHIDHHLGRIHESGALKVYCPGKWLVGQDGGPSNISGKNNGVMFWTDPEKLSDENQIKWEAKPVISVFLESTIEVAVELERRGWHRGHWQNEQRLDRGVCAAIASLNPRNGLNEWHKAVSPEAVRQGSECVCLFHPSLPWSCVTTLECAAFHRIQAETADDAQMQLTDIKRIGMQSPSIKRRNLIYHIWPKLGNGVWEWNVKQLLARIKQFDGIRSVAVVTSEDSAKLVDVQRAFDGVRINNWIQSPNDPNLCEVASFEKLLRTVERDRTSNTFYAHAKGVSYSDPMKTREWTEMLYEICLDDPQYVEASLSSYPLAGPFTVMNKWPGGNRHGWYYSGAFFWFRNAEAFTAPDALAIRQDRWGAELWPGNHFAQKDAGVLFGQNAGYLYEQGELARMRQWLVEWKSHSRQLKAA